MKRNLLLILTFSYLFTSCSDDNRSEFDIIYTPLNPEFSIKLVDSVKYVDSYVFGCENLEFHLLDTSINYHIDIDQNGENDFRIYSNSGSGICHYNDKCDDRLSYACFVTVESLKQSDSISIRYAGIKTNFFHQFGDTIQEYQKDRRWVSEWMFLVSGGCNVQFFDYQDSYIGIKSGENFGWIQISTNGGIISRVARPFVFRIQGYAINRVDKIPILAGQIE